MTYADFYSNAQVQALLERLRTYPDVFEQYMKFHYKTGNKDGKIHLERIQRSV
jgi:hypothetical protein